MYGLASPPIPAFKTYDSETASLEFDQERNTPYYV